MVTVWWKLIRKKRRWMNLGDWKAEFVVAPKAIFYSTPGTTAGILHSGFSAEGTFISAFAVPVHLLDEDWENMTLNEPKKAWNNTDGIPLSRRNLQVNSPPPTPRPAPSSAQVCPPPPPPPPPPPEYFRHLLIPCRGDIHFCVLGILRGGPQWKGTRHVDNPKRTTQTSRPCRQLIKEGVAFD